MYSRFYQERDAFDSPFLWNWDTSDCLIIDDVNPGLPVTKDIVEPSEFLNFVEHDVHGDRNKEILRSKKVIWVMGENQASTQKQINDWQDVIRSIGVDPVDTQIIDLTQA